MSTTQITIPELSDEQQELIAIRWREQLRQKRMKEMDVAPNGEDAEMVRKLYLITFPIHQSVAFPDEQGRAVHHTSFYAWLERRADDRLGFYGGEVEAVAQGDGRWLKNPIKVLLNGSGIIALVEVSPEILHL